MESLRSLPSFSNLTGLKNQTISLNCVADEILPSSYWLLWGSESHFIYKQLNSHSTIWKKLLYRLCSHPLRLPPFQDFPHGSAYFSSAYWSCCSLSELYATGLCGKLGWDLSGTGIKCGADLIFFPSFKDWIAFIICPLLSFLQCIQTALKNILLRVHLNYQRES